MDISQDTALLRDLGQLVCTVFKVFAQKQQSPLPRWFDLVTALAHNPSLPTEMPAHDDCPSCQGAQGEVHELPEDLCELVWYQLYTSGVIMDQSASTAASFALLALAESTEAGMAALINRLGKLHSVVLDDAASEAVPESQRWYREDQAQMAKFGGSYVNLKNQGNQLHCVDT